MSGILVIAEHLRGELAEVSRELVGAALQARATLGGPVRVLVADPEPGRYLAALRLEGVDEIYTQVTPAEPFDPAVVEEAAWRAAARAQPALVLLGHSSSGMSCGAGLAVRLGAGFAADVFAFGTGPVGALEVTRAGYGAKVNVVLDFPGHACTVLTVRASTFKPPAAGGAAVDVALEPALDAASAQYEHLEYIDPPAAGLDIAKAEFILSIGRGVQDEKNVPRFVALAERLGMSLGCSRPLADAGWLHKAHQVGLTGKVAGSCKLYVALGISGAVQHLHGMKHVETIIAVNTDPHAPIFNVATVGAAVDVLEFADELERLL